MASVSIKARIDSDLWESLKAPGESSTELLQRLSAYYVACQAPELAAIAQQPAAAIAVLLDNRQQLNKLLQNASVALPADTVAAPEPTEQASAASCADDW